MKYLSLINVVIYVVAVILALSTKEWYAAAGFTAAMWWSLISFLNELEKEDKRHSVSDNN